MVYMYGKEQHNLYNDRVKFCDLTIAVGLDSYQTDTSTWGITWRILSVQNINSMGSVCIVRGFSIINNTLYISMIDAVSVADGLVRVTYI